MAFLLQKLVAKPDQLIKRRGKLGLIKVGADLAGVKQWIGERLGHEIKVGLMFCHIYKSKSLP